MRAHAQTKHIDAHAQTQELSLTHTNHRYRHARPHAQTHARLTKSRAQVFSCICWVGREDEAHILSIFSSPNAQHPPRRSTTAQINTAQQHDYTTHPNTTLHNNTNEHTEHDYTDISKRATLSLCNITSQHYATHTPFFFLYFTLSTLFHSNTVLVLPPPFPSFPFLSFLISLLLLYSFFSTLLNLLYSTLLYSTCLYSPLLYSITARQNSNIITRHAPAHPWSTVRQAPRRGHQGRQRAAYAGAQQL
jgi:hypothetical protein